MPDMTSQIKSGAVANLSQTGALRQQPPQMTSAAMIKTPAGMPTSPGPADILQGEIVARPLTKPGNKLVSKNPSLSFRWVFRGSVNIPNGAGAHRLDEMESLGFEYATPADCDVVGLKPRDGRFIMGDLILMKMARSDYEGALKYNESLSTAHLTPKATIARGASMLAQELASVPGNIQDKRKITMMTEAEHVAALDAVPGGVVVKPAVTNSTK